MLYLLPKHVYDRINQVQGNGQSQLLQEVKRVLAQTFPRTDLSANGQVVEVPFNSYSVDVVPSFKCTDGTYIICQTANGGFWGTSNPIAEYRAITDVNAISGQKATHLIKMLKAWKNSCNVPIKSIVLEIVVCLFVNQWLHKKERINWYGWMIKDFFEYLYRYPNCTVNIPGTQEVISLGDSWLSKCESAYKRAIKACDYEYINNAFEAENEWKKIFGDQFQRVS